MSVIISTENLAIGHRAPSGRTLLRDLNVELRAGEVICLLGPNGTGKTTLLRTLAGLLPPRAGRVLLEGRSLETMSRADLARRRSVILTAASGIGFLSAREMVSLGRLPYTPWTGRMRDEDESAIHDAMVSTGCLDLADRPISQISDGERQRVFVARALAQETPLLILDEPTAFLDLPRRAELVKVLTKLAREGNRSVILSLHDLELAIESADRFWLISRDGRFEEGIPEELVLSGAIARAFDTDEIRFNADTGRFGWSLGTGPEIAVRGEGLAAQWTRHALSRLGYRVCDDAATTVAILEGERRNWRLLADGTDRVSSSLAELLEMLKERTLRS